MLSLSTCSIIFAASFVVTSTTTVTNTATSSVDPVVTETPAPALVASEKHASKETEDTHEDQDPFFGIHIHGLVSQGLIKTTDNNYLAKSKRWSPEFTEVALNFTKQLTDDLRVGIQFFSRDLGPQGNYNAKFDWYYLDYHWQDWLGVRVGRVKLPFGLYNETSDIDQARVPILLPQAIYPIENRDILLAVTGADIYGRVPLSLFGSLDYRLYGGTIFVDNPPIVPGPLMLLGIDSPYLYGGRMLWETPLDGFRIGGSVQALRLDFLYRLDAATIALLKGAGIVAPEFSGDVTVQIPFLLWTLSAEYNLGGLLLSAEYGRWNGKPRSDQPVLFPEQDVTNERFYAMASYRLAKWFTPGVYYSVFVPNVEQRNVVEGIQRDFAVTLRFDINDFWLVKLEGHYMRGTAALSSALNEGRTLDKLEPKWALFLAKTTLYF